MHMSTAPAQGRHILAKLMQAHTGCPVQSADMQTVAEGASGRCIMRADLPECRGIIGIYWTPDRADNAAFLSAAHGLRRAGVPVPDVLAEQDCGAGCGACLVEDLGTRSLLSLRGQAWEVRQAAYRAALRSLARFHQVQPDWELQPPFDCALYRWEQEYFAEHFLGRHLGRADAPALAADPAWRESAEWLATLPRTPIHRDCQSQNILLRGDEACFIDFQGMRMGRPEYDLASLLCDPYMELSPREQADLLSYWSAISPAPLQPEVYAACALQRLMQALGAFANIGYNAHNTWYLQLIPAGVRALLQACSAVPSRSPAARLALCLRSVVTSSK